MIGDLACRLYRAVVIPAVRPRELIARNARQQVPGKPFLGSTSTLATEPVTGQRTDVGQLSPSVSPCSRQIDIRINPRLRGAWAAAGDENL